MRLYGRDGQRLYINDDERNRLLVAARNADPNVRTLFGTLIFTGCRLSEALSLTPASVQALRPVISICTLKRRRKTVVREVPVPLSFVAELEAVHQIDAAKRDPQLARQRLWHVSRTTAWRSIKALMAEAGIHGAQATAKGLRHGYGVHATCMGVQLQMLQKWMGHAKLETTAIYANATGPEEQRIAGRMWSNENDSPGFGKGY